MKLAWKQLLIKSLYLKLLVTVKHWGRETEVVSDWQSDLRAPNCVHAGFILALDGPLLLFLTSTFLLSPPHQLDSFHLCIPLMFFRSSSIFPSSSSSFRLASRQSPLLPSPKSLQVALWWIDAKIYIKTYESLIYTGCTHWYCDLPHTEISLTHGLLRELKRTASVKSGLSYLISLM